MEAFKKGIHNNELRKYLMLHQPVITTKDVLKQAVQNTQTYDMLGHSTTRK